MEIDLIHDRTDQNSTSWRLAIGGVFECYALGLPRYFEGVENVREKCCIPYGRYPVEVGFSPHMKTECPHILNVPDRDHILIHVGNTPNEILGCFAVGQARGVDYVSSSKLAFVPLVAKIVKALESGSVFINVKPADDLKP